MNSINSHHFSTGTDSTKLCLVPSAHVHVEMLTMLPSSIPHTFNIECKTSSLPNTQPYRCMSMVCSSTLLEYSIKYLSTVLLHHDELIHNCFSQCLYFNTFYQGNSCIHLLITHSFLNQVTNPLLLIKDGVSSLSNFWSCGMYHSWHSTFTSH